MKHIEEKDPNVAEETLKTVASSLADHYVHNDQETLRTFINQSSSYRTALSRCKTALNDAILNDPIIIPSISELDEKIQQIDRHLEMPPQPSNRAIAQAIATRDMLLIQKKIRSNISPAKLRKDLEKAKATGQNSIKIGQYRRFLAEAVSKTVRDQTHE